jgi:hypothetical protein
MWKTRQKDTWVRRALRYYSNQRIEAAEDLKVRVPLEDYGHFLLKVGLAPSEVEAHTLAALVMDQLVLEGEFWYGDEGRDTAVRYTLEEESKLWLMMEERSRQNPGVINYYKLLSQREANKQLPAPIHENVE